ncbi:hypothetical protein AK812_SmicGene2874 [Symbiodinium microadriaticum]|uniref:Uncharacterized protein n=1 Tax=Symbiodinium microadriaticum TaxID=2951 RepID=A0A1Q9F0N8_SYMMI|nr:hypothetical protein AK812_SmicGene2874 [Symbiodinium microadriaticum]
MERRVQRLGPGIFLLFLAVTWLSTAWVSPSRSARSSQIPRSAEAAASASQPGRLPESLVAGPLSKPESFQDSFLMGFVKAAGDRWQAVDDDTEEVQGSTREALVAAVRNFKSRGAEEQQIWDDYVQSELGTIIGDPYAFDLRIKLLDNQARKALRRASRQVMMDEMLKSSKSSRKAKEMSDA